MPMMPVLVMRVSAEISHNIAQERQVLFERADFLYTAKGEIFGVGEQNNTFPRPKGHGAVLSLHAKSLRAVAEGSHPPSLPSPV